MKKVKQWYQTIELSAHCLCEQGYNAYNLIEIAKHIEKTTGIKANPIAQDIRKTIEFHSWFEGQERKAENRKKRISKLHQKQEQIFSEQPAELKQKLIQENRNNYWKAVGCFAKKQRKGENHEQCSERCIKAGDRENQDAERAADDRGNNQQFQQI